MATPRRTDTESERAQLLLDVTEQLMLEQGYAGVSSRSVAARAGVTAPLVHYYFATLDDLFVAVHRRRTDANQARLTAELQTTEQPLWTIWEYSLDRTGTALTQEFMALANHRKAIRAQILRTAERLRRIQYHAVAGVLRGYGVDTKLITPAALLLFMSAVPRVIVIEKTLGMSTGHADAVAAVEHFLRQFEGPRAASSGKVGRRKRRSG